MSEAYFLDAEGFMWRDAGNGMVSMARTNPDNSPVPEPRTYLVPAERVARIKAEALREAASDWASGEWRAVNFNRAGRDEHPGMRQARWLRERADRIEAAS